MIGDIRLEFLKRVMTLLIKISKGDTYLEKLESSYKTNLIVLFFLLAAFLGIFAKYMDVNRFSKDAEAAYRSMVRSVEEAKEISRSLRVANDDKSERITELKKQNAQYKDEITVLVARLDALEGNPPRIGECKKEQPK